MNPTAEIKNHLELEKKDMYTNLIYGATWK